MQKKQKMSKHGTAVRCKVCPKPALNANYCCSQCSDENDGNIFGLCGPKSGRVCIPIHQKSMWSSLGYMYAARNSVVTFHCLSPALHEMK